MLIRNLTRGVLYLVKNGRLTPLRGGATLDVDVTRSVQQLIDRGKVEEIEEEKLKRGRRKKKQPEPEPERLTETESEGEVNNE